MLRYESVFCDMILEILGTGISMSKSGCCSYWSVLSSSCALFLFEREGDLDELGPLATGARRKVFPRSSMGINLRVVPLSMGSCVDPGS